MSKTIRSNIYKYYFFQAFLSFEAFAPVIVLFWQSKGLNMTQIMLLQSIYAVGVIILELPTGALADWLGKRITLILGALFYTIGFIFYGLSNSFNQFAIGELIVATGMAFISGADRAFIHETLKSIKIEKKYSQIEGRARSLNQLSRSLANIVGGLVGAISLSFSILTTGLFTFFGFLTSLTFRQSKAIVAREEDTAYLKIIRQSLKIISQNSQLVWLILFFALFNAMVWNTNWFAQPYLKYLGVSTVYFGIIFAVFNLISAVGSSLTFKFEKITGKNQFTVLSIITLLTMFLVAKFANIYLFFSWSLLITAAIINQTLVSEKILALVPETRAATVLSFANLVRRLVYALTGPVVGKIADNLGMLSAIQINALILLISLIALFSVKDKMYKV